MEIWPNLLTVFFKFLMFIEANQLMSTTHTEMNSKNCVGRQNEGKQLLKYAKVTCICNIYINSTSTFTRFIDNYFYFQIYPEKEYLVTHFELAFLIIIWTLARAIHGTMETIVQSGTHWSLKAYLLTSPKESLLSIFWLIFYRKQEKNLLKYMKHSDHL